ncbi:9556_t:CDS:2 [Entrophospora sp. SA101]|nr:9556_t:CDS:2 [Entrophospora sp. SA101]
MNDSLKKLTLELTSSSSSFFKVEDVANLHLRPSLLKNSGGKILYRNSEEKPNGLVLRAERATSECLALCIPKPLEIMAPKFLMVEENRSAGIISLDPGVRTFAAGYNPSGEVIEWRKGCISGIHRLCLHYDRIRARWLVMRKPPCRTKDMIKNSVLEKSIPFSPTSAPQIREYP